MLSQRDRMDVWPVEASHLQCWRSTHWQGVSRLLLLLPIYAIMSQSLLACQATTLLKSCLKCIVQHELAGWELISLAHYCAMSYSITHPVASLSSHLSMTVCMSRIQHETMKMPCSLTYGGSLIRPESTGFGTVYFTQEILKDQDTDLKVTLPHCICNSTCTTP